MGIGVKIIGVMTRSCSDQTLYVIERNGASGIPIDNKGPTINFPSPRGFYSIAVDEDHLYGGIVSLLHS